MSWELKLVNQPNVLNLVNRPFVLKLVHKGIQGAPAGPTIVNFSFDSASPLVVLPLAAGAVVLDVMLQIITPFDDPAATLTLGTAADASRFLGSGDNLPGQAGGYGDDLPQYFTASETMRLFISPGSSTQGTGKIIVRYQ